jgi:hypothetical protein
MNTIGIGNVVQSESLLDNGDSTTIEGTMISIIQQIDEEMMMNYVKDMVAIAEKHEMSRLNGTEGCEEAMRYILNEFMSLGIETNIHNWAEIGLIFPYRNLLFVSENIEGILPGDPYSDQTIILMAHYDTVALTRSADDNSAGVAAVLSAAKILRQYEFNHEIRFLLVSGEEEGLLGSTAYAFNSYQTCDSIITVINLDMIGYSDPEIEDDENKIRIYETCSIPKTDDIINICDNPFYSPYINFEVVSSNVDTGHVSDQRSFCNYGYDSIFLHEYTWNNNKDRGTDTIENMDINYATRVARLAATIVADFALSPIPDNRPPNPPSYIDGAKYLSINEEQTYKTTGSDPDGDDIYYMFDWGDGTHSNWLGPYASDEICETTNTWHEMGEFSIRVKAKDSYGIQSPWVNTQKSVEPNILIKLLMKLIDLFPFLESWFLV